MSLHSNAAITLIIYFSPSLISYAVFAQAMVRSCVSVVGGQGD
jgi:hypothetical protein